ncbi:MAG: hypothetical protein JHC22_05875 [Thermoproteus sp.]|jgi:hypothetical protein|nr:hypothetical protein [Thermoproteus sp.]
MSVLEALIYATAAYALAVIATYLFLVGRTPGCRGKVLRCIKAKELVAVAIIVLAQAALMALMAVFLL